VANERALSSAFLSGNSELVTFNFATKRQRASEGGLSALEWFPETPIRGPMVAPNPLPEAQRAADCGRTYDRKTPHPEIKINLIAIKLAGCSAP
jgi:hypothetical protein